VNHNAGNRHALQCSERTRLSRSSKKLLLVIILSFLSLTCQGGDGGTTGIPPITVAFYQIDTDAAWSPDGKSVLFVKGDWPDSAWRGGIYLHDLATGRDSLISRNYLASSLTWAPDQKWIAYSQGAQIYAMKLNGDSLIRLTSGGRNFSCRWSPLGNRIAYHTTSSPYGMWFCDRDGSNKRKVYGNAGSPAWFSDGFGLAGLAGC
jgi:dipeptidyl aminopeptidase/acylaminoacyl peptidase